MKRIFQKHKKLIRVETFFATGTKWARCIQEKHLKDFAANAYVESTYIPEQEWRKQYNDETIEVYVRDNASAS